jgi:serine O-acetyltransferase
MKKLFVFLNIFRFFIHTLCFVVSKNKPLIKEDLAAYKKEYQLLGTDGYALLYLLTFNRSFRSLFYYRIGGCKLLIRWLAPGIQGLRINNIPIGGGLLLFHAFGTILNATSIGKNCRIVQNVTLGDKKGQKPVIMDNVEILTNAVIVGGITIGNNCVIGPGAVVFKDIPDNCVVVGNPSYILKQDGVIVNKKL